MTPSLEFIRSILARSNPEILKILIKRYFPKYHSIDHEVRKTNAFLENHFLENMISEIELFPDVIPFLKKIKKLGLLLSAVTNAPKNVVEPLLKKLQSIDSFFDIILTINDVHHGKPDPEMLIKALKKLDLSISEVIFIGDSIDTDGRASDLAAIPFVWINRKVLPKKFNIPTISSLQELFEFI